MSTREIIQFCSTQDVVKAESLNRLGLTRGVETPGIVKTGEQVRVGGDSESKSI